MNSAMRRITARLAATTLVGVAALSAAPAAQAWTLGTQIGVATITPATGTDDDTLAISTPAACPDAATYGQIVLYGAGFPAEGWNITANNPVTIFPQNAAGGYDSIGTLDSLANFALAQTPPATYSGNYTVALVCKKSFGTADFGDFVATLSFSDPHHYTSGAPVAVATTTTLAASPAGSAGVGAAVSLTATVTPAAATGSVQFFDGTTSLGTATVSGAAAHLSTSALAGGNHSLTAVFTPTAPIGATPSTSAAVAYTVVALPAVSRPSALVLPVGTHFTCPGGSKQVVPPAAIGQAASCVSGGPYIVGAAGIAPVALVAPSLSGSGKVGTKLTLKPGVWTPAYKTRTVTWKRDGKVIAKAAGGAYVVTKADKGHHISATVTAHLPGHLDGTASTSPTKTRGIVAGASLDGVSLAAATDTTANALPITVPVGSVIGCVAGTFTGATTTASAWFLDGVQVSTDPVLVLGDKSAGHTVVCRTTGTNVAGTVVSDATITVVPGAALLSYVKPRIVGAAKVGKKFVADVGKWYPGSMHASFVWLRNGKAIKGATAATYVLKAADKRHSISVRVTAHHAGYADGTAVSAAVSVG